MQSSNPMMNSLTAASRGKQGNLGNHNAQQPNNPYGNNPYGQQDMAGYGQVATATQAGAYRQGMESHANFGKAGQSDRPMTIDDVVTKTGITLAVIIVGAVINYFVSSSDPGLGTMLTFVGMIGGLIAVLVSSFGKVYGSPVLTLLYAAFEGLFVGGFSFMFAGMMVGQANAGALIAQAVLGTLGVFVGMLFVYKTGAIRVTPKFTRFMVGAMIGVLVLALGNFVFALISGSAGPLRDGGPISIIFSLLCIALAAMSFLLDFDQADSLVRAGAPSKMAWGVALGLAVTLVWLYIEILRLLSYLQRD